MTLVLAAWLYMHVAVWLERFHPLSEHLGLVYDLFSKVTVRTGESRFEQGRQVCVGSSGVCLVLTRYCASRIVG